MKRNLSILLLALAAGSGSIGFAQTNPYTQRFIDLRAKIVNPANGYFSPDGVPYHTPETLICEAPDYGHETTSEAYSYWIWLEAMNGRVTGDWSALNAAWAKMEAKAIPTPDLQPTTSAYNPSAPATYAAEFPLPDNYPAPLIPVGQAPVGQDPVSPDLTATYGSNIYGMHWIFDCDNFYGFGNKGDGVSTPSYMNTFQRGEQESVWETIPQPCWESFKWGSGAAGGYLTLFTKETSAPTQQWKYTNAPDADARAVQAIYWAAQFAKEQGLNPATTLPLAKASKMGDFGRLAMFDKYFKTIGSQSVSGGAGTGYSSAHYLLSWYYAWGGPLTPQGWAWRIGSSHAHFGYQNPVSAFALATSPELKAISANGPRDWAQSLTRQLEFYQWLQSAEGAIAGGATNSFNGRYDPYPVGTPTFYGMAYQENPVYHDPGSNTWFGFQAWSMERVAEYYYITGDAKIKPVLDKWIAWVKTVVHLLPNGTFELPSEISWSGAPNTWNPAAPVPNTNLHVIIVSSGQDLGIAAATAKALTYYAAATQKFGTLDTASRDLAKEVLDRMWTNYFEPTGKGVATVEERKDYTRFFNQTVFVPSFYSGKMPNGDAIVPGIKFLDIRSKYKADPDFPAVQAAVTAGVPFKKTYHRFWAQADIALANAEFGRFFGGPVVPVAVTGVTVTPAIATVGVGSTTALTATVAPATASNKVVTWTSNNPAVATVNAAGIVTGVAGGSATITATTQDGGITASSSVTVSISNVPVTGVTVTPTSATVAVGATTALTATVAPANASNKTVSWTSSNTAVATVNASGVVTGVAPGSAMITVTTQSGSFTASAAITVPSINVPATGVTVTPASGSIAVGATTTLTATVAPANATNKSVTWSSSSPAIATVNASGVVTGVAAGSATITATTVSGGFTGSATITVTSGGTGGTPCATPTTATLPLAQNGVGDLCFVTSGNITFINSWNTQLVEINGVAFTNQWSNAMPARINGNYYIHYVANVAWAHLEVNGSSGAGSVAVTGVSVTPTTVSVATGGTATLAATVAPANASNKSVTWSSSNTAVATVNGSGVVTGVSVGSATVTAKTQDGGFTGSATVTVTNTNIPVTGVTVSPTSVTVAAGSTTPLTATVAPANATTKTVTWSSSNTAVATVNATGVVTGVSAGAATITATAQGGLSASSLVTVTGGTTGGTPCANGTAITLPFAQNGAADSCFVASGNVNFINSWNMQLVEINGVNYTNKWANSLPPRINGNYYIHYVATVPWAHLEINGN